MFIAEFFLEDSQRLIVGIYGLKISMTSTIKDVAAYAGVSFKTVSNVVNGNVNVSDKTRKKVLEAIEHLGYLPHETAKSLVTRKTQRLGFVIFQPPDVAYQDPFIAQITIGMHEIINQHGYSLLVKAVPLNLSEEIRIDKIFGLGQVDAIIMVSLPEKLSKDLEDGISSVPLISLDEGSENGQLSIVCVNNRYDGYLATHHLLKLGRRKIAIILPTPLDHRPSLRRLEGYIDALDEFQIPVEPRLIVETQYTLQSAYDQTLNLLLEGDFPDAFFVADDKRALAVMEAIRSKNLRIPEDISIVGYGDWMVGRYLSPALTSIHQPFREMGRVAAEKAIQRIQQPSVGTGKLEIATHLVIRESCGAPKEMRTAQNGTIVIRGFS